MKEDDKIPAIRIRRGSAGGQPKKASAGGQLRQNSGSSILGSAGGVPKKKKPPVR